MSVNKFWSLALLPIFSMVAFKLSRCKDQSTLTKEKFSIVVKSYAFLGCLASGECGLLLNPYGSLSYTYRP